MRQYTLGHKYLQNCAWLSGLSEWRERRHISKKVHPRTQISTELRLTVRSVRMKRATSYFKEL